MTIQQIKCLISVTMPCKQIVIGTMNSRLRKNRNSSLHWRVDSVVGKSTRQTGIWKLFPNRLSPFIFLIVFLGNLTIQGAGFEYPDLVVDPNGRGDYKTIAEAIQALSMFTYQRSVIEIKNGVYHEKIRINKNYVTLRGENRDSTIIRYPQPREAWNQNPDAVGPAVVNLHGDDAIIENLTIENSQPEIGPHAFALYGDGTRTVIKHCNLLSRGGDTVSLWNYKDGMYYLVDCFLQGAVDFLCPRGWCYVRDSRFFEVKQTASIWHAGHYRPDQKFVLRNCDFDGVEEFQLGRHHYDAAFYFLNCHFSKNLANQPVYRVLQQDSTKDNPNDYGERCYFDQCIKEGKPFDWIHDNLKQAENHPQPGAITPSWTFGGRWNPESGESVQVVDFQLNSPELILIFNEIVTVKGRPQFHNRDGKRFRIRMRRFTDTNRLGFVADESITPRDLMGEMTLQDGMILGSTAGIHDRTLNSVFQIQKHFREK